MDKNYRKHRTDLKYKNVKFYRTTCAEKIVLQNVGSENWHSNVCGSYNMPNLVKLNIAVKPYYYYYYYCLQQHENLVVVFEKHLNILIKLTTLKDLLPVAWINWEAIAGLF